jgi:hypothetical protein
VPVGEPAHVERLAAALLLLKMTHDPAGGTGCG